MKCRDRYFDTTCALLPRRAGRPARAGRPGRARAVRTVRRHALGRGRARHGDREGPAGTLVGRIDRGDDRDRRPHADDQWSPRVNGVPRGRSSGLRGRDVNVFIPGGRYRIAMRGDGHRPLRARQRRRGRLARSDRCCAPCPGRTRSATTGRVRAPRRHAQGHFGARRTRTTRVTAQQTILVVEDEQAIASFVSLYLKNAGYAVRAVTTGAGALNAVASEMPSLIVLDLNLPDMDGVEICRRIRKTSDVPILMLTARDEDVDKIIGLEVGADDYLTKPFNPRELVARVKSVLRRSTSDRRIDGGDEIRHGDLVVNAGPARGARRRRRDPARPEGVRPALGAARPPRHRPHARPAARAGLGIHVRRATRAPSTCTCGRSAASSVTRRRSSPCGASATRSRPSGTPPPRASACSCPRPTVRVAPEDGPGSPLRTRDARSR